MLVGQNETLTHAKDVQRAGIVINAHSDYSIEVAKARNDGETAVLARTYAQRLRDGGVDAEFYTVGGDHWMFTRHDDLLFGTLRNIDHVHRETVESPEFTIATSSQDIVEAKHRGKHALVLALEGAAPVGEELYKLRALYRLGVRSITLTWFKANSAADGVGEDRQGGLSRFGRDLIREMNHLGMLVDVSQMPASGFWDVLRCSEQPVIASHSNAASVRPHRRNLTDDQIQALSAQGGLICVSSFPNHLADQHPTLDRLLDHIDYIVNLAGVQSVGVGFNFVTHNPELVSQWFDQSRIEYSVLHLPGLEDVSRVPALTAGLLSRGYASDAIHALLGGNLLRVLESTIG